MQKKLDSKYLIWFALILSSALMFISCKNEKNNKNPDKISDKMIDLFVREDSTNKKTIQTINLQIPDNVRLIEDMIILIEDSLGYNKGDLKSYLDTSDFLNNNNLTIETLPAFFIPNTYELYSNLSSKDLMKKMKEEYQKFWNSKRINKLDSLIIVLADSKNLNFNNELIRDSIPDSLRSKMKIKVSILASIIEEEQDWRIKERSIIAGVYLNRIKKGIKLQSDPTLIFALGDFSIKRVLKKDKKIDSPFNTYIYKGLPPGPICIPSIHAIDAVLNAVQHDYLFMCAKEDFSGYHNFSCCYKKHQYKTCNRKERTHLENARRYQNELNRRRIKR